MDQTLSPGPSTLCGYSDQSVRKLKGPGRPINAEADRAAVIAALICVDYVPERSTTAVVKRIRDGEGASPAT